MKREKPEYPIKTKKEMQIIDMGFAKSTNFKPAFFV